MDRLIDQGFNEAYGKTKDEDMRSRAEHFGVKWFI